MMDLASRKNLKESLGYDMLIVEAKKKLTDRMNALRSARGAFDMEGEECKDKVDRLSFAINHAENALKEMEECQRIVKEVHDNWQC